MLDDNEFGKAITDLPGEDEFKKEYVRAIVLEKWDNVTVRYEMKEYGFDKVEFDDLRSAIESLGDYESLRDVDIHYHGRLIKLVKGVDGIWRAYHPEMNDKAQPVIDILNA